MGRKAAWKDDQNHGHNLYKRNNIFMEKTEHFRSIGHVACIRFDKLRDLHPDSDDEYKMYNVVELKTIELTADPVARRNMNILYEFTKKYSDDAILEELKEKIEEIRSAA